MLHYLTFSSLTNTPCAAHSNNTGTRKRVLNYEKIEIDRSDAVLKSQADTVDCKDEWADVTAAVLMYLGGACFGFYPYG